MSTDALYNVVIRLTQEQGASGPFSQDTINKAERLDTHVSKIRSNVADFARGMADSFTSTLDKVAEVGMGIAKWGAAGAIGAVTLGVGKLNNEFEKTSISLASIFNANGAAGSIGEGLELAKGAMSQIRKDAAALPGETGDLVNIFRANAIQGLRAGKDIAGIEKFSANVMAAGATAGLDMATVARESGQLLAGRAGAHNILGSTLFGLSGAEAQAFNQKSASDRFEFLAEGMKKYGAAIDTFGHSFEGLSSSLYDNTKNYLRLATEPVFEKVKQALEVVNSWMSRNDTFLKAEANSIGTWIASAFERGEEAIVKWFPLVRNFAAVAEERIIGVWHRIEPIVERISGMLERSLSDPNGTIDKLAAIFGAGAALKFAGPLSSLAEAGLGAAGVGGGAAGAAGAGVLAAGAFDVYAMTSAVNQSSFAQERWLEITNKSSDVVAHLTTVMSELEPAVDAVVVKVGEGMLWVLDQFISKVDDWVKMGDAVVDTMGKVFNYLKDQSQQVKKALGIDDAPKLGPDEPLSIARNAIIPLMHGMAAFGTPAEQAAKDRKPVQGGGGTTIHIDHLEMPINQNGDPNRVARAVIDKFADFQRFPTSSRYSRNYSAMR